MEVTKKLTGKTCLITGATSGIGLETSLGLAEEDATLFLLCRNQAKAEKAKRKIVSASGNEKVHLIIADLESLGDVRKAAKEFLEQSDELHVLINNAGLISTSRNLMRIPDQACH